MTRKLTERPERVSFIERARRDQIVKAATELLAEGGYGAASLASIATRIGVSKGVISYHFAGKDELLRVVVDTVLADAAATMEPAIAQAPDARSMLQAYVRANLDYLGSHRTEVRALGAVLSGLPPAADGSPAYGAHGRAAVESLAELIASGQRSGAFGSGDATIIARSVRAAIDAVTETLRTEPDLDVAAYGEQLLELFETGLLA